MKKEALRLYPNILEENNVLEKRGLLSLIRDHLIDLSFLDDKQDNSSISLKSRVKMGDEEQVDVEKTSRVPDLHWRATYASEIRSGNGETSNKSTTLPLLKYFK